MERNEKIEQSDKVEQSDKASLIELLNVNNATSVKKPVDNVLRGYDDPNSIDSDDIYLDKDQRPRSQQN
jgi:hypothetical protein